MKERERGEKTFIYWFSPQMAAVARVSQAKVTSLI